MFERVKFDFKRLIDQEPNMPTKLAGLLFNPGFHAVLLYRLAHWFSTHHLGAIALIVSYLNAVVTGAQISARAVIGKGLVIYHPHGMVIGGTAVIGDFCTLTQGNVIGQHRGGGDRPTISDHFYAGVGAKILGNIRIGHHVRVGANAVVLQSLPDCVTAIGLPAKIVSYKKTHSLSRDRWQSKSSI
jgi:serine O-acetyltransferase